MPTPRLRPRPRPRPRPGAALLAAFVASACTAILVPDVDDDGVARCDLSSDCPPIPDNRYVAVCVLSETLDEGADKICSVEYDAVYCGGTDYGPDHPLTSTYLMAVSDPLRYGACATELLGSRGCGPDDDGGCAPGLVENSYGTCDDPEAAVLSVGAGQLDLDDAVGHDVQDQFCRSYFCDDRFVCSHRGDRPRCVVCDPSRFFGRSGCGTLYLQGQPSGVYLDAEQGGNCDGDAGPSELVLGPLAP